MARLWTYDGARSSMTESRFVVSVGTAAKLAEDHPATNYALLRNERKRTDLEAYDRLLARVRNLREPLADDELSIAIGAVDKARSFGDRPEHRVLASPDGDYVALAPQFSRPVVVNTRTLETYRLLDQSDPLQLPMAWSSDSRSLAFAPSEASGQIFIYDVRQHAQQPTIEGPGRLITALQWSSDNTQLASLDLVNRRLHKTPLGLFVAGMGHPDYRNDLVLRIYTFAGRISAPVQLKRDLTEQSAYDYWIEWRQ